MFERFTDRARRLVVLAQEEARMLGHNYVGTEHLLLGLIREGDGVAAKALESLGISLVAVRQLVEEIIGPGDQVPSEGIPFTPRAKKVLELALRESLQLGDDSIGTEHILLGLIREGGVAVQVLVKLGAELNRVRQRVIELIVGQCPQPGRQPPREGAPVIEVQARLDAVEGRLAAGQHGWQQRAAIGSVFGRWAEIVGRDLAAHHQAGELRRRRARGDGRLDGLGDPGPAARPAAGPAAGCRTRRRDGPPGEGPRPGGPGSGSAPLTWTSISADLGPA